MDQIKRVSSLEKTFNKLGAWGLDATLAEICDRCPQSEMCKKGIIVCNAMSVICHMAMNITLDSLAPINGQVFLGKLKKATADVKR